MKLGPSWIVVEESQNGVRSLVSIINPRWSYEFVSKFVTQMAVDKHASFEEMIAYKKNKNSWPYPAVIKEIFGAMLIH